MLKRLKGLAERVDRTLRNENERYKLAELMNSVKIAFGPDDDERDGHAPGMLLHLARKDASVLAGLIDRA